MTLYEESKLRIWTDPYICRKLLLAHLDTNSDAASRRPETIGRTVDWVLAGADKSSWIVDFGCGPGFYAEKFAMAGLQVTGIDINKASLDYARRSAMAKNLSIDYRFANYLNIDLGKPCDIISCIYCDFGALTYPQQDTFLKIAHRNLAIGGTLILDVFGPGISNTKTEGRTWSKEGMGGFWAKGHHYVLSETSHFKEQRVWGSKQTNLKEKNAP